MAERAIYRSQRVCPRHVMRLERPHGNDTWRCTARGCPTTAKRIRSVFWLAHLSALGIRKPESSS